MKYNNFFTTLRILKNSFEADLFPISPPPPPPICENVHARQSCDLAYTLFGSIRTEIGFDDDVHASSAQSSYLSTTNLDCVRHSIAKLRLGMRRRPSTHPSARSAHVRYDELLIPRDLSRFHIFNNTDTT